MADITDVSDSNGVYQVVNEVINDLVDMAGEELYDNYVAEKVRNVALDHIMDEISSALRCINLPHDIGERGISWVPDEDPECPPIDTWSSGAVPSKKKKQSFLSQIRGGDTDSQSVGSRTRSSRRTHTSRRSKSKKDVENTPARPAIIMSASSPNARPSTLMPQAGQYEEKNSELDELERIQREEQARIEQLRREQAEEDARYRALQEELKGKEYTFDAEGNLIVIARINAEKTGGLAHLLGTDRFGLDDQGLPDAGDIPAVVLDEAPETTATQKKKKKKKKKRKSSAVPGKSKEVDPAHFQIDPTKQPPLLSTIRLVPGVTLKEGQAAKQGPQPADDSLHMSRSDFLQHQSRLERTGGADSSFDDSIALEDLDVVAGATKRGSTAYVVADIAVYRQFSV